MSEDKVKEAARLITEAAHEEAEKHEEHVDYDAIQSWKGAVIKEVKNEVYGPYGY